MKENISKEKIMTQLINETWELQKALHQQMETSAMKKIQEACKDYYLAVRATGAGGGGCMLFYTKPPLKRQLITRLNIINKKIKAARVIPFQFDYKGIELIKK